MKTKLACLALVATSSVASAGGRQHLLTPALTARLSAAARANNAGVGTWQRGQGKGSVFLIGRRGDRALFLTNQHVAAAAPELGEIVLPAGTATPTHVVASSKALDYALVAADLKEAADVAPLKLARRDGEGAIYKLSGTGAWQSILDRQQPATWVDSLKEQLAVTRTNKAALGKVLFEQTDELRTIESGRATPWRRALGKLQVLRLMVMNVLLGSPRRFFDLKGLPGNSGSPILDRDTHEVVALTMGGAHHLGITVGTSTSAIRADLARQIARGKIVGEDADLVTALTR